MHLVLRIPGGIMEMLTYFIQFFVHLDDNLKLVIQDYGPWTYLILFLIIFCETGLVVTPFFPGDSLLFVVGAFAAAGALEIWWLLGLLGIAAVAGDSMNYWIGNYLGKRFNRKSVFFVKKEYMERTHRFYEKYGGKALIIARFVPIIRTYAPFLAGVGSMSYWRFATYNIVGGIAWISVFICAGYFFGNLLFVKQNFTLFIFVIIIISIMPGVIEYLRHRSHSL
ncbi:MAG: DedA family protein [Candidatus Methanoperedens sp.]|nr:DedA family protein [Candidatus Methanoperedens sp.]MCE8424272.1 DedA family protein [Candidatus Methanoperedens sp.]MCE8426857.1 DedA family protein [Candidatus Methanoperedens sp.]